MKTTIDYWSYWNAGGCAQGVIYIKALKSLGTIKIQLRDGTLDACRDTE